MSHTCSADAIIGVRFLKSKLFELKRLPQCGHEFDRESFSFCPHCGRKAYELERVFRFGDSAVGEHRITALPGMTVVWREDHIYIAGVLAHEYWGDYQQDPVQLSSIDEIRDNVRRALLPHGLWDESLFGLWVAVGDY